MDGGNTTRQILIALASNLESGILNHASELLLARESLDTLDEVLIAIPVTGHKLSNERNGTERPLLVDGVEERVLVDLAELETGENTARLEYTVSLLQRGGDVCEVANAECDGVQIEGVVLNAGRQDLGVGFEEGEAGLMGGGEGEGAVATDGEHGWVDVGDCDVDVGVEVLGVGVL